MTNQFRLDNAPEYTPEEIDVLNGAFDAIYAEKVFAADADPDFVSDTRQLIGARLEDLWFPTMTAEMLAEAYRDNHDPYRETPLVWNQFVTATDR